MGERTAPGGLGTALVILSHLFQFSHCAFIDHVPGIQRGSRLEQQNPAFFFGDGFVLDSARDHDELTLFELNGLVAELDAETSFYHEEHFVFIFVVMPDEFAFQFVELHQLSIEFTSDVGLPVFVDLGEFVGDVDYIHDGL